MKRVVAGKEISIYDKRCLKLSKEEVQRRLDANLVLILVITFFTPEFFIYSKSVKKDPA